MRRAGIAVIASTGVVLPAQAAAEEAKLVPMPAPAPAAPRTPESPLAPKDDRLPVALWVGGRTGVLAFGDSFYVNPTGSQQPETTGSYLKPGPFLQADVGVRIAKQYIPYVAVELAELPPGSRFAGQGAHATTFFAGVGFRYVARLVQRVGFAADLSFGLRRVTLADATGSYSMQAWEVFRLGLGAEIRLSHSWTMSPMVTISGGVMGQTSGHIAFAPGQQDGLTAPPFQNGSSIPSAYIANYLDVSVGVGAHFDIPLR